MTRDRTTRNNELSRPISTNIFVSPLPPQNRSPQKKSPAGFHAKNRTHPRISQAFPPWVPFSPPFPCFVPIFPPSAPSCTVSYRSRPILIGLQPPRSSYSQISGSAFGLLSAFSFSEFLGAIRRQ